MATEYVFKGSSKEAGDKTNRLILEGSYVDPKRYMDLNGDPVELSDEEVAGLKKNGWKIHKAGETGEESVEQTDEEAKKQQQKEQAPPASAPAPATETGVKNASKK